MSRTGSRSLPWWARFARRVLRYQREPAQLVGDSVVASASASGGELALLAFFVALLLGLPLVAVAVGVDSFGDKWAFVLTLVAWPMILNAYAVKARRREEAGDSVRLSGVALFVNQLVFFVLALLGVVGFALLLRLVRGSHFTGANVLRGFLWGAAIASGVVVARDAVALLLALRRGVPVYAERPDAADGSRPRKLSPPGHALVRTLLALIGLAAVGFACVILTWPAPFAASSDSTTTTVAPPKAQSGATGLQTTTVTAHTSNSPSNALVGAVLGAGVLLLLAAALFDRLQEIKGPGGTGIVLAPPPTPSEEDKRKIAELVPALWREAKGTDPSPQEAAAATVDAVTAAQSRLWRMRVAHSDLKPENIVAADPKQRMIGPIDVLFRTQLSEDDLRAAVGEAVGLEVVDEDAR